MARVLIAAGADVNAYDDTQWTTLHVATKRGHETIAQTLIEAGALANAAGLYSVTPLTIALALHRTPIISALLTHGGDVALARQFQAAWFADPECSIDGVLYRADVGVTEESFTKLRDRIRTAGVKDFDDFTSVRLSDGCLPIAF